MISLTYCPFCNKKLHVHAYTDFQYIECNSCIYCFKIINSNKKTILTSFIYRVFNDKFIVTFDFVEQILSIDNVLNVKCNLPWFNPDFLDMINFQIKLDDLIRIYVVLN